MAGAPRFCWEVLPPVLEGEREGEELACSAQFPEETASIEPKTGSWVNGPHRPYGISKTGVLPKHAGDLCDEDKAVEVVWEGEGDKPQTLGSPGHREKVFLIKMLSS